MTLKTNHTPWDDALARIDPARFEALLADYFRGRGWVVEQVGADFTGQRFDRGFDLALRREDAHVIVQCKRWKAFQVPHHEVRELHAIMLNEAATGAIYVTSGEFTAAAIDVAARLGQLELVDGDALRAMLDQDTVEAAARDGAPPMYAHPQLTLSAGPRVRPAPRRGLLVPALALAACVVVCAGVVHSLNAMVRPLPRMTATRGARVPPVPDDAGRQSAAPALDPYSLAGEGSAMRRAPSEDDAARARDVTGRNSAPAVPRGIDIDAARAAVRPLDGVRDVFWLDDNDLVVVVDRDRVNADGMIGTVCRALAPLGDNASVVVELQWAASKKASEPLRSRRCATSPAALAPSIVARGVPGSDGRPH
ncbi:restriction endonuclease [Dokdonella sp.]|uniref:restriction endonuclease n=1 Tax=Dokdonella sp. TaxID=2291710 RepID=UPI002F3EE72A